MRRGFNVIQVRTKVFTETLSKLCEECKDEWSEMVAGRLSYAQDLFAASAAYHQSYNVNLRMNKQIPQQYNTDGKFGSKKAKPSRTEDSLQAEAFSKFADILVKIDDDQLTFVDLGDKMRDYLHRSYLDPYAAKQTKRKLIDPFDDALIIILLNGKSNVVTVRKTAESILHDLYTNPKATILEIASSWFAEMAAQPI